jgi:hypothetical protein
MAFPSQSKSVQQQQVFRLAIAYLEGWQKNPVEINRNPTAGSNPDLRPNSHRDQILNDSPHSIRNRHSVGLGESGHLDVLHLNILTAWRNSHHFALVADQAAIVIFDDFSEGIMIPVAFIGGQTVSRPQLVRPRKQFQKAVAVLPTYWGIVCHRCLE